ncbi:hypothetical protein TRFO_12144 [Tritrichomonas foetus]|uniref:Uncharacterized protein n=1 Tax=Tritrichomonas foetus TaxID=1144522 RepID=A0A1J4J036_9EUKA|nr:hypothetical protein TRFO_12144 [Tritrichomonas foetus]|eukprot:OHS92960.1 hypothetical protein TRFO_12144 [Tritrichomonas foetus]
MSIDEYDVDDAPFPLIRGVFEDVQEANAVRMEDLRDYIHTIALQSVADGRVTVLINKPVVFCSLNEMSNEYLFQFRKMRMPVLMTQGEETTVVTTNKVIVPKSIPAVSFDVIGAITASVRFRYIQSPNNLPSDIQYPIVCIGFPAPPEDPQLVQDFANYLQERIFPLTSYDSLVKKRTKMERRNRDYLIQTSKTRHSMIQRYNDASATYKKRQRQFEALTEKVNTVTNTNRLKTPNMEDIASTIERIDAAINVLVETTDKLSDELDHKSKGKQMTRHEELELLQTLKQQVRDSRAQLEVLKEQGNH